MMLKSESRPPKSRAWGLLRAGVMGLGALIGGAAVTGGCLDRPVSPAVPQTSNVYVAEIRQTAVDKIDLLFMIDNSISMADKQAILAKAVPVLVSRLVTPVCVAADGTPTGQNASADGKCPDGQEPEFDPIKDIHVGIVTSSLGAHGATFSKAGSERVVCDQESDNDHAQLLGKVRATLANDSYNNQGFLKWDAAGKYSPPGDASPMAFNTKFTRMVTESGEQGCGYESSLEAWYRFLIDPEPPKEVKLTPAGNTLQTSFVEGVDETVLAQRAAFLRPDSLVAVIMLTDENDCSVVDEGYGWVLHKYPDSVPMLRATSQCAANPNDPCCQSCAESGARMGCPPLTEDAECKKGRQFTEAEVKSSVDTSNLRCWNQKRRFGFDLLYPISRYVSGLRDAQVPLRSKPGQTVVNPLFAGGRDRSLVFFAGIVGVPWQDIADEASLGDPNKLRYLTADQMAAATPNRWDVILGRPETSPPVPPSDPFMFETPEDRTALAAVTSKQNPITNEALVDSSSTNPRANSINGHEQKNVGDANQRFNQDLQYACTFKLTEAITCDAAREQAGKGCDCDPDELGYNRPLCQPPAGGPAGTTQHFAKAYPGLRHLQALREFGSNSIVASICPKISTDETNPDFGYNPAVAAIIDRLKEALKGKCLPRPLVPNNTGAEQNGLEPGQVPCAVIEAVVPQDGGACNCNPDARRISVTDRPELRSAVLNLLKSNQTCVDDNSTDARATKCGDFCTCELAQLSGNELQRCQTEEAELDVPGYCYINAAPNEDNVGNPALVAECSEDSKRLLRFVGNTPANGAIALVACLGASLGSSQ